MNLQTGTYLVVGDDFAGMDIGLVEGVAEKGYRVFWHWTGHATVFAGSPCTTVHATIEDAEAEAERRWKELVELRSKAGIRR